MNLYGVFDPNLNLMVHYYPATTQKNFGSKYPGCVQIDITGTDPRAYTWNGSEPVLDTNYTPPEEANPVGDDLLIEEVLENQFKKYKFNAVDFKRHLKPPNALDKRTYKRTDGRPEKAEYFIVRDDETEVLVATVYFYFIINPEGVVTRRTEHLKYKRKNGNETDPIVIKNKVYNLLNKEDFTLAIEESEKGRKHIISEIKGVLLGRLTEENPTLTPKQVKALGKPFFNEQKTNIENFIELADEDFRDAVLAIDLNTTPHDWLSVEVVPSSGVTLKDYMVATLTYSAISNHPDA